MLDAFRGSASASSLPRTLVIHHREDSCRVTLPSSVEPFMAWAGARARVTWLSGGRSEGDVCGARAYHGYNGIEGQMVGAVVRFARSGR